MPGAEREKRADIQPPEEARAIFNPEALFERANLEVKVVERTAEKFEALVKEDEKKAEAPPEAEALAREMGGTKKEAVGLGQKLREKVRELKGKWILSKIQGLRQEGERGSAGAKKFEKNSVELAAKLVAWLETIKPLNKETLLAVTEKTKGIDLAGQKMLGDFFIANIEHCPDLDEDMVMAIWPSLCWVCLVCGC